MSTKTLDFVFDFGSPNAYLCYKVLPPILERTGARLNLMACLLGGIFKATGNQSPREAFGNVTGKLEYEALERKRFIERHGLSLFKPNPFFPVNTLTLMRGLVAVQGDGEADAYIDAVLGGMWEQGENMADKDVFVRVLSAAGLDAEAILARTQDQAIKDRLIANTNEAVARGAFGSPTFFVGGEMFFGKERLNQVEEALAA